jgi:prophage maintenance system killer protein
VEAQMEFEYAKHVFLARQGQKLRAEYQALASMPVGMEAFQDDYDSFLAATASSTDENVVT